MREADLHFPPQTIEAMGFESLAACFEDGIVRDVTVLACDDSSGIVVSTATEPLDDALDAADTVEWWERRERDGGPPAYLYEVVAPAGLGGRPSSRGLGPAVRRVAVEEGGVTLTLTGSQRALGREIRSYDAVDAPVALGRLTDVRGPREHLDRLTPRQREVLETAYDLGYYEVPRGTTADAIARRLDLDRSTVAEHLQRAERNLVTGALSG